MELATIDEIIKDLSYGRMCIIVDSEDRENEGDLVACASTITPEQINFMAMFGRGLICLSMSEAETIRLGLSPMVQQNQCPHGSGLYDINRCKKRLRDRDFGI